MCLICTGAGIYCILAVDVRDILCGTCIPAVHTVHVEPLSGSMHRMKFCGETCIISQWFSCSLVFCLCTTMTDYCHHYLLHENIMQFRRPCFRCITKGLASMLCTLTICKIWVLLPSILVPFNIEAMYTIATQLHCPLFECIKHKASTKNSRSVLEHGHQPCPQPIV